MASASRSAFSFIAPSFDHLQGLHEELRTAEITGLERKEVRLTALRGGPGYAGIDLRSDGERTHAERFHDRTGSFATRHHELAYSLARELAGDLAECLLDRLAFPAHDRFGRRRSIDERALAQVLYGESDRGVDIDAFRLNLESGAAEGRDLTQRRLRAATGEHDRGAAEPRQRGCARFPHAECARDSHGETRAAGGELHLAARF